MRNKDLYSKLSIQYSQMVKTSEHSLKIVVQIRVLKKLQRVLDISD